MQRTVNQTADTAAPAWSGLSMVVVGAGYVGLATAVGLATRGHRVELVENGTDRLTALRDGRIPLSEPGLQEAYGEALRDGRIVVRGEPGATSADVVFVCVGTPTTDAGRSDWSQLRGALRAVAGLVGAGVPLVLRSTLPVGTTEQLLALIGTGSARVFTNPEFLRQGNALQDFLHPTRVVIGHFLDVDREALATVRAILEVPGAPLLVVDAVDADLIKNGANAFLALKLSFANEMAVLCEELGGDAGRVLEGIGMDPRIGPAHLNPSFGFGGSCLPKELRTLAASGLNANLPMHMVSAAANANASTQSRFARRIERSLGGVRGRRIALLGLAFKAGTDDVRESPALQLAERLLAGGADVRAYDPAATENARRELPELTTTKSAADALAGAELAVIATEWPEFRSLPWAELRGVMAVPRILDGRRLLDSDAIAAAGFAYETIGLRSTQALG
jgi:UDPglucose 6-dehydrogenase